MMHIEYNESIDFICAVFRTAHRKHIRDRKKELGLEGIPQIEKWVTELEDTLNPFLLSDIDLLVRKLPVTTWNLIKLAKTPYLCTSAEEFIERLTSIRQEDFILSVKESISLKHDEEITRERILYKLTETTSDALVRPEEESEMILALLKNPGAFLERIKNLYREFYETIFSKSSNMFSEILNEKLDWHKQKLSEQPLKYLDEITRQIFSAVFDDGEEPELFLSFFYDFDIYASTCNNIMIIGAGTDEIIKSKSNRKKADLLFSVLGDNKRLELLRLIAKRPWYSSELAEHFKITPATMSYHLNKMVSAGFVKLYHGDQKRYYYTLNKESVGEYFRAAADDILGSEGMN